MYRKHAALLLTVGLLCALEYLQAGMVAFASAPIRGEIDASPEEFSLVVALYACTAVLVISKQRWLVERLGWRSFMLGSISIYIAGAVVCGVANDLASFTTGRLVMGVGGASFMTSARLMVNMLPPGPERFMGIKVFATGLAAGTASAPFITSLVVVADTWHAIFWLLILIAGLAGFMCTRFLPDILEPEHQRTASSPGNILLLAVSSFFLLYILQRSYYDFYNDTLIMCGFALVAVLGIFTFFQSEHQKAEPFLKVRELIHSRYLLGIALFCFTYIVIGSNNYIFPYFLQTALGYSWESIGVFQSYGLTGALLAWTIMSIVIPRSPAPKKFFLAGFAALMGAGWLLSSLTLEASMWSNVLPALLLHGCFIMLILATAAMHTFRDIDDNSTLFAHAYQIKGMLGQISMAVGTAIATLFLQWRTTTQYSNLNGHFNSIDPMYREQSHHLTQLLASQVGESHGGMLAVSILEQSLRQQATLVASMEYFSIIVVLAAVALIVSLLQKTFR